MGRRSRILALAALAVVLPALARAGSSTAPWTAIGPYGGAVVAKIAVDPSNPQTVYAATRAGVWKSVDGAQHWTWSSKGIENMYGTTMAIDPANSAHLFAGTLGRLYVSNDAADSWTPVDISPMGWPEIDVLAVAFAPSDPKIVYAGDVNGVFRSGDAGVHWSRVQTDQVDALAVSPRDPNVVYASTPKALLKTVDGGVSWKPLPIEQPWVSSLVIDKSNPAVLYAAAGRVWKSIDAGANWNALNTPADRELFDLALSPSHPATIYAAGRGGPDVYTGGLTSYAARSDDGGASWTSLGALPGSTLAPVIAAAPGQQDVIYAGTFYRGMYKSSDAGTTFASANEGLGGEPAWAIAFGPKDPNTVYASIGESGLYRSDDGGSAWTNVSAGVDVSNDNASIYSLSTDGTGTVYAARNLEGHSSAPRILKTADGGKSWSNAAHGLPDADVFTKSVYADPDTPGTVFAAISELPGNTTLDLDQLHGALYRSTDGGDSWAAVSPTNLPIEAVAFDNADHAIALASGTVGEKGDVQVYESTDWGDTWQKLGYPGFWVNSLAFGPDPSTIYAGAVNLAEVARSTDAGATWTSSLLDPVTYNGPGLINALAVDPVDPALVYAATEEEGIWMSSDHGSTWKPLGPPLGGVRAMTLAFAPAGESSTSPLRSAPPIRPLYGGTVGAGVAVIYPSPHAMTGPSVAGQARVGRTLTCRPGAWSRAETFRYSWWRGKTPLIRHKTQRYKITRRDRRSYLRCRVAATGPGGKTIAISQPVRVRR